MSKKLLEFFHAKLHLSFKPAKLFQRKTKMAILRIPVKRQNARKKDKRVLFSCYDMYHIHQESGREAKRELDDFLSVA